MIESYIQIAELILLEKYIISREYGPEDDPDRDVPGYTVTDKKTGREKHFVNVSREGGTTKVTTYNPRRHRPGKDSGNREYTGERAKRILRAIQRMKKNKKNTVVK